LVAQYAQVRTHGNHSGETGDRTAATVGGRDGGGTLP
jgi:hypothetical protein